jgi:[histone H3]-lysine4 N-trimethyltransferase ASH1L
MSFDQNMIIDATTGSIARFVNHSCNPNCRMVKWIVAGQPRMALFAGDRPIMTGEELTYDYNFDPFSAKNVQKCLCGEKNCRGVLGPKPKEVKAKAELKDAVKNTLKAGKRKFKELVGDDGEDATGNGNGNPAKKRKTKAATGVKATASSTTVKRTLSNASMKVAKGAAKGAATAVRKSVSSISVTTKAALSSSKSAASKASGGARKASTASVLKAAVSRKASTGRILKTYSSQSPRRQMAKVSTSRASSLTIVAAATGDENARPGAGGGGKKKPSASPLRKTGVTKKNSPLAKKSSPSWKKASPAAKKSLEKPRKGLELSRAAKIRLVGPLSDDE